MKKILGWIREKYHPCWRLRKVGWIRYFFIHWDLVIRSRIYGRHVYLYLLRDISFWLLRKEPEPEVSRIFDFLVARLRPRVFWDVGANVGNYSWRLAAIDPGAELVLFEPDPKNFRLLSKTVKNSDLSNARLLNCAV